MAMLDDVKAALNITGDFQNSALNIYIADVQGFLTEGGVPASAITPALVARGVADLWNYGAGDGKLSPYFIQRAAQLALKVR